MPHERVEPALGAPPPGCGPLDEVGGPVQSPQQGEGFEAAVAGQLPELRIGEIETTEVAAALDTIRAIRTIRTNGQCSTRS